MQFFIWITIYFCFWFCARVKPNAFVQFFLFHNVFLQYFLFAKLITFFLELALSGFPIRWKSSISLDSYSTSISANTGVTVLYNSLSAIVSGMTIRTKLFLLPYCSRLFVEISNDTSLFSKLLHLVLSFLLSSCSLLIIMSFKIVVSFWRLLILVAMFSFNWCNAGSIRYLDLVPRSCALFGNEILIKLIKQKSKNYFMTIIKEFQTSNKTKRDWKFLISLQNSKYYIVFSRLTFPLSRLF